jgi:hypothetical protein
MTPSSVVEPIGLPENTSTENRRPSYQAVSTVRQIDQIPGARILDEVHDESQDSCRIRR